MKQHGGDIERLRLRMERWPLNTDAGYLGIRDLAAVLDVSVPTIHNWRRAGRIPLPYYVDRYPRWSRHALALLAERGVQPVGTYSVKAGPVKKPAGKKRTPKVSKDLRAALKANDIAIAHALNETGRKKK